MSPVCCSECLPTQTPVLGHLFPDNYDIHLETIATWKQVSLGTRMETTNP